MTDEPTEEAARRAEALDRVSKTDPEPSLAKRFGQIGVLGWMIVLPALAGAYAGTWLDTRTGAGITFAAAGLFVGVGFGFWIALKWMRNQ